MAHTEQTSDQKDKVKGFFDDDVGWKGGFYEDTTRPFSRMLGRRKTYAFELLKKLPSRPGGSAIDLGCGSGVYLTELAALGYQTFGMDLSLEMLTVARAKSSPHSVGLASGDIETLPYKSGVFDVVFSIGVLGYLHSDERALNEIHRILKPGGVLLLNVRNRYPLTSLHYSLRRELRASRESSNGVSIADWTADLRGYHNKVYSLRKFESVVRSHGFRLLDSLTFGHEFNITRKLKVIPSGFLDTLELKLERWFRKIPIPFLRYSGWGYVGLFRKETGK